MSYIPEEHSYRPALPPVPPPRISGTAMPHGVFLSTGSAGTSSAAGLFITGFSIVSLGIISLIPTYVILWTLQEHLADQHLSLVALLLQMGGPGDPLRWAIGRIVVNLVSFFAFLVLLRATPLAAHHAAEHMTVHAIEHHGTDGWQEYVAEEPRAHRRCGSNLLAGILPAMLIGLPLLPLFPPLGIVVAVGGWIYRQRLGYFLQNTFTTKPPTPRQLQKGIDAGLEVIEKWRREPTPVLPTAQVLWRRGMPQMAAGAICGVYVMGQVVEIVSNWLDW